MPKDDKPTATQPDEAAAATLAETSDAQDDASSPPPTEPEEIGGPAGPEPTRFGDWERKGRCIDF